MTDSLGCFAMGYMLAVCGVPTWAAIALIMIAALCLAIQRQMEGL